jgi:hypothetical protein
MDYMAGNLGLNTRYRGNKKEPLCIYANDYDKNGSIDPVMTYYLQGTKHIVHARDELISQISAMRLRFRKYKDYADATFEQSFLPTELESAYVVCSEWFETSYVENSGDGKFLIKALPIESQFSTVFGMVAGDYDHDDNLDIVLVGNMYASDVNTGWYDASVGLYLRGDGRGNFQPSKADDSGLFADGDAKGMVEIIRPDKEVFLLVGNNAGPTKTFALTQKYKTYLPNPDDAFALLTLANGKVSRHEFSYGSTYLSESSRALRYSGSVVKIEVYNFRGESRQIVPEQ